MAPSFNVESPLQTAVQVTMQNPKILFPFMISKWLEETYEMDDIATSILSLERTELDVEKADGESKFGLVNSAVYNHNMVLSKDD